MRIRLLALVVSKAGKSSQLLSQRCFDAAIDRNRSMHIPKAAVLRLAPVQAPLERVQKTAAFEMCILLLRSMAAENTAETVAASSYLPRIPPIEASRNEFPFIFNGVASPYLQDTPLFT